MPGSRNMLCVTTCLVFVCLLTGVRATALRRRVHHHHHHHEQPLQYQWHGKHQRSQPLGWNSEVVGVDNSNNAPAKSSFASGMATLDAVVDNLRTRNSPEVQYPLEVDEYPLPGSDAGDGQAVQALSEQLMHSSDALYDELRDSLHKVMLSKHVSKKLEAPRKIRYEFVGKR